MNLENCPLCLSSIISQLLDFFHCVVFDFIFYCVKMHTLYSSNHDFITAPCWTTRNGPPTWRFHTKLYDFARNISTNISILGHEHTLNLENCLLCLSSIISQFLDFIHCIVFDFILYCATNAYTL